jgi:hypothetical protein
MNKTYTARIAYGELHINILPTTLEQAQRLAAEVAIDYPTWAIYVTSFNPHGYGAPSFRVYGVPKR